MKIKLGKNYWVEIYTAKQYDKLFGADITAYSIKLIVFGLRLDKYKDYTEERFSDASVVYGKNKLGIISRGTICNCSLKEFVDNLRYTWN